MHTTSVAGHMDEFKTLYRILLRFFWSRMRTGVNKWIQKCPHCPLIYRWRRRGQEWMFS